MVLTAPFDGVVADIQPGLGEVVASGAPVVTFGDFGGWLVKTSDLTELDVVRPEGGRPGRDPDRRHTRRSAAGAQCPISPRPRS